MIEVYIIAGIQFISTIAGFCIIKFNDLRHLEKDMNGVKESHIKLSDALGDLTSDVSYIKGKIDNT